MKPVLCEELLAMKYTEEKDVYLLTTIHNEATVAVPVQGRGTRTNKPECVLDYNRHMGGVEKSDQYCKEDHGMMPIKEFVVVEFVREKAVEVVHLTWLEKVDGASRGESDEELGERRKKRPSRFEDVGDFDDQADVYGGVP
ncbi:PiggyBac transposable element-derived protein 4 [Acipenser ruthenus]|uniref:PiggyBac transposable element-derived protein 4 n=1 Tax=Acipenser ruthenus TaxID=7906 RepID=A0A662YQB9_ACIRT|nr:PiggyBac transposable element-derived protein 4 [Acipenser ruthenus]